MRPPHFPELLTVIDEESVRLRSMAPGVLTADVPTCPGWTVSDVLAHLGDIHRRVVIMIRTGEISTPGSFRPPDPDSVPAWFEEGVGPLLAALSDGDAQREVTTWAGPRPLAWWQRRMAQEIRVHRWDVERAIGTPEPIATELALQGIEEYLQLFLPRKLDPAGFRAVGRSLDLQASDDPAAWLVRFDAEGATVEESSVEGDASLRGTASALLLALWGHDGGEPVEVSGDRSLVERFEGRPRP